MAKKSMIARDVKRKKLVERYAAKRNALLEAFNSANDPMERLEIHRKIQNLPRNSAPSRMRNRCCATGKRSIAVARGFCGSADVACVYATMMARYRTSNANRGEGWRGNNIVERRRDRTLAAQVAYCAHQGRTQTDPH